MREVSIPQMGAQGTPAKVNAFAVGKQSSRNTRIDLSHAGWIIGDGC